MLGPCQCRSGTAGKYRAVQWRTRNTLQLQMTVLTFNRHTFEAYQHFVPPKEVQKKNKKKQCIGPSSTPYTRRGWAWRHHSSSIHHQFTHMWLHHFPTFPTSVLYCFNGLCEECVTYDDECPTSSAPILTHRDQLSNKSSQPGPLQTQQTGTNL